MKNSKREIEILQEKKEQLEIEIDSSKEKLKSFHKKIQKTASDIILANVPCCKDYKVEVFLSTNSVEIRIPTIRDGSKYLADVRVYFRSGKLDDVSMALPMISLKRYPDLLKIREVCFILSKDMLDGKQYLKEIGKSTALLDELVGINNQLEREQQHVIEQIRDIEKYLLNTKKLELYFNDYKCIGLPEFTPVYIEKFLKERPATTVKNNIAPGFRAASLGKADAIEAILDRLYI